MNNKELDLNPIYDELHKQGFGYTTTKTLEDYILLFPGKTGDEIDYDEYNKVRGKEFLRCIGMSEDEAIEYTNMTQEEKDQIKLTVRYKKLKQEMEEIENLLDNK